MGRNKQAARKRKVSPYSKGQAFGRPRKAIDWRQFDKLCELQPTQEEFASYFNCSIDTIERACLRDKKMTFAEYFRQKAGLGKLSLRRAQHKAAINGNVTMQIWLGKQRLGQRDKPVDEQHEKDRLHTLVESLDGLGKKFNVSVTASTDS